MTHRRPQHTPGRHRKPSTTIIQKLAQTLRPKPKPVTHIDTSTADTVLLHRIT